MMFTPINDRSVIITRLRKSNENGIALQQLVDILEALGNEYVKGIAKATPIAELVTPEEIIGHAPLFCRQKRLDISQDTN